MTENLVNLSKKSQNVSEISRELLRKFINLYELNLGEKEEEKINNVYAFQSISKLFEFTKKIGKPLSRREKISLIIGVAFASSKALVVGNYKIIYLYPFLPPSRKKRVLLHENYHILETIYNFDYREEKEDNSYDKFFGAMIFALILSLFTKFNEVIGVKLTNDVEKAILWLSIISIVSSIYFFHDYFKRPSEVRARAAERYLNNNQFAEVLKKLN